MRFPIDDCLLADRQRFQSRLQQIAQREKQGKPADRMRERLAEAVNASLSVVEQRRAKLPAISFPEELPVSQKRDDIATALANHQVIIVAGETGSGKTTQLPKICLEHGRGIHGVIGHTQPRRIAARTVATRIAEELDVSIGESVGYQVRFTDHSSEHTHIKLMTDGILLAEIQNDRDLRRYDTLIIDEAHERSLNIDFLLGYLKQLLPRRPDLKVIITSATIDVERLARHFDGAPVVQVSGRTYPVDVYYRPVLEYEDMIDAIVSTVQDVLAEESGHSGDFLVFLSGERDIRETALALRKAQIPHLEILPLYARLSLAEQNKVFHGHKGRRIVLATNVAETSITVPGIRYVIDPGYARISRYSYKTKVLRLPIEPISQASANQRKGRSGRVANGVCIRLYDEEDFNSRPEYTEPEILRSNLASVILQMAQLQLGEIRDFPFVDMPDKRLINDGYKLLEELQALDKRGRLTELGRQQTQFSVDPRFARMCLAADRFGCLKEMLIIVSALTIQDPRERPADKQQASDEKHRRFWEPNSDFLAYINLWNYVEQQRQDLSQNQFRNLCKKEFLSFLRLREWRDLHYQLRLTAKHLGLRESRSVGSRSDEEGASVNYESVHRALITGLLGNIGNLTEERSYLGPRNRRFSIFPGSSLFKSTPKWVIAGELIETTKLYAHTVAKVEPEWLLDAADHLVKRHHFEPHYDARRGQVMAYERVTLYGLTLVEKRRVNYGRIDPVEAREIFIQAALVEARYRPPTGKEPRFFRHNKALMEELLDMEAKTRRRDIVAEDRDIYRFFDERVPADVVNLKGFEAWRKQAERETPDLLYIPRELLMQNAALDVTEAQFPNELEWKGIHYPLSYQFSPGQAEDGVSIHVPIHGLHMVPEHRLQWLVPGMLREKCIQLVKGLPRQWRKHFVPVPDYVSKALAHMEVSDEPLAVSLGRALKKITGVEVPAESWAAVNLDPYYRFNIKVLNEKGKVVDSSRDLGELFATYRGRLQDSLRDAGESIERDALESWDFGELPETVHLKKNGGTTVGFPALVDTGSAVNLRLQDDPQRAIYLSQQGLARLIALELKQTTKYAQKNLLKGKNMALRLASFGQPEKLKDDLILAAIRHICVDGQPLPRDREQFDKLLNRARQQFTGKVQELESLLIKFADTLLEVQSMMAARADKPLFKSIRADIVEQTKQLTRPGFLFHTPPQWLQQYPQYLLGIKTRIEKSDAQIQKDHARQLELQPFRERLKSYWESQDDYLLWQDAELQTYRWMLEEFRLSLFAQPMKTSVPVSPKRLEKQWENTVASR
ncbi:ATP-dependent RNA helicase HrpA [Proteobacteria bacterium 005FR1]|nr:ATP-dependent RNA helicase HrpA [Proteobacteria bacterium 005FR1]